ncbi:hypothetical protein J5X98_15980 [Leptothermofonsia sichuanensis E412]|uniref:hypothetical protein n=1 Tax=Leptothermofonsia sichuanensis TaxID=2917832 RepID=UPI001CA74159|nr:hypothetical protein [Leptothermofonsia sichuanensis]QZZ18938.1 hypothetical protein J5X98_15980 [Leptothermofonsia sichuanensis E412]
MHRFRIPGNRISGEKFNETWVSGRRNPIALPVSWMDGVWLDGKLRKVPCQAIAQKKGPGNRQDPV